jgi:hypothetical protein
VIAHEGRCLCGALRYEARAEPLRVTICHCRFCQRATGSAYMVEPIFRCDDLAVTQGKPSTFDLRSEGSGKIVHIHFCSTCGTKLYLTFERFPEICGVYAGTFDNPNWFEIAPENAKHIFIDVARHDTILPPGMNAFSEHSITREGAPNEPRCFDRPTRIIDRGSEEARALSDPQGQKAGLQGTPQPMTVASSSRLLQHKPAIG